MERHFEFGSVESVFEIFTRPYWYLSSNNIFQLSFLECEKDSNRILTAKKVCEECQLQDIEMVENNFS